jgi:hypothetical protein
MPLRYGADHAASPAEYLDSHRKVRDAEDAINTLVTMSKQDFAARVRAKEQAFKVRTLQRRWRALQGRYALIDKDQAALERRRAQTDREVADVEQRLKAAGGPRPKSRRKKQRGAP